MSYLAIRSLPRHPLGKRAGQRGAIGLQHAPLGDQTRDQPRRGYVETVIGNRRSLWNDAYALDPPIRSPARHHGDLVGGPLLDRNLPNTVVDTEVDGRRWQGHIDRHAIVMRGERLQIGA